MDKKELRHKKKHDRLTKKYNNKVRFKKDRHTENQITPWRIVTFSILISIVVGLLSWWQIARYEDGVLEIYAFQQDGYVELVLKQINLVKDRDDDDIIQNILATMDASTNIYWTFSREDTLIFVKDIVETNRYRGYNNDNYYVSDSARNFIRDMRLNNVIHRTIDVSNKEYIVSGVIFEYKDKEYGLCLLTNRDVVLDHNAYLSARMNLLVLLVCVIITLIMVSVVLGQYVGNWKKRYVEEHRLTNEQNKTIQLLNERLTQGDLYDTRYMAFKMNLLGRILESLEKKKTYPVVFMILQIDSEEAKKHFFSRAQAMLSQGVMRFAMDDTHVLLIGIMMKSKPLMMSLQPLLSDQVKICGMTTAKGEGEAELKEVYQHFCDGVFEYGK